MKKRITLCLLFVFSLIVLASCTLGGGNSDPGTTINVPTENKTPTPTTETSNEGGSSSQQGDTTPSSSTTNTTPEGKSSTSTSTRPVAPTTTTGQVTPTTNTQTAPESSSTTPAERYTVDFVTDCDTTVTPQTIVAGGKVTEPQAPSKTATSQYTYTFAGWFTDLTSNDSYDFNSEVNSSFTLYAKWNKVTNQYTYIFYDEDGTTPLKTQTADYGAQIEAPANPTKESTVQKTYEFDGWYTAKVGGTKVTSFPTLTENVNYYARYTEVSTNTITEDTAYSFRGFKQQSQDEIIFTGSWNNSAASTSNKLTIDTSGGGKFAPNSSGDWYQANSNTIISFETSQAVTIKLSLYAAASLTLSGPGLSTTVSESAPTFVTNAAGTVYITVNADNTYFGFLEITMRDMTRVPSNLTLYTISTAAAETSKAGNGTYRTSTAKTIYLQGESIDTTGVYAVVNYTDNTSEVKDANSGLEFSNFSTANTGKSSITVSYTSGGVTKSTYYDIYVVAINPVTQNNTIQVKVDYTSGVVPGTNNGDYTEFKTINQALDYLRSIHKNASYKNYDMLMYICSGTYHEKIEIDLPNLTIVGEDEDTTMIEYDALWGETEANGFTHVTDSTQTVTIREEATNLIMYNLTISNYWNEKSRFVTAGKDNEHRALAMLIYADKVIIQKCKLLGYQDTLEAMTGRSWFYQSYISGTVDFIFGTNCTIYFEECEIHSVDNQSTDGGYINAFKGANKVQNDGSATDYVVYGAIYNKCTFTADSTITASNTSIARPWSKYSAVMIMNSVIGAHISTAAYTSNTYKNQRYVSWGSKSTDAQATDSTIKHLEYKNTGDSAIYATQAGVEVLTSSTEAAKYSNFEYIFGTTNGGVTYSSAWSPVKYVAPENPTSDLTITAQDGYAEGMYVEFSSSKAVTAYYKKSTDSSYTKVDSELVRRSSGTGRVDVIGLTAGTYTVKLVDTTSAEVVSKALTVVADDRSGYAHFDNSTHTSRSVAVGAYNVDGTLKSNAKVLYVTDENKNTITYDGCTGLVEILQGNHSVPLDIRIIGSIKTTQWNQVKYTEAAKSVALYEKQSEKLGGTGKTGKVYASTILDSNNNWNSYSDDIALGITELNGLTSYASCSIKDSGKTSEHYEWDSYWNMCDISERSNITIEGIGIDATIFQWGFTFAKCNSIEIKNLTFDDYTEDAIGIQGGDSTHLDYGNFWIHNCTFEEGVNRWDVSYEQDKGDGDGSTDFKYAHNLTISYCKYNGTHKTNLIGANNAALQYNITLHHNYYLNCKARLPLVRQANIHMYNNYYKGTTSTGISARAHAFAFVENCYFDGKNPYMLAYETSKSVDPVGTTIKAIGNQFSSSTSTSDSSSNGLGIMQNGIFVLTGADSNKAYSSDLTATRTTTSSTSVCTPVGSSDYTNFDTSSTLFYYTGSASDVTRMDNASSLPTTIPTIAGAGVCGGSFTGGISSSGGSSSGGSQTETQYTLSYSTAHGTAPSSKQTTEITSSDLPTLTATGYTFGGWYLEQTFDTQATTGAISSDTTLYAKWTQNSQSSTTKVILDPSDLSQDIDKDITNSVTSGDFIIVGTSSKAVTVKNGTSFTYDSHSYETSKSLYLGGGADFSASRYIEFTLSQTSTITIVAKSSSSTSDRIVNMVNASSTGTVVTTFAAGGTQSITTRTDISAGTYRVGSSGSGIYIYAIIIEY